MFITLSEERLLNKSRHFIISPILFCVYLDSLLQLLRESGVGCYIGRVFTGALAYADDVVLTALTSNAMRIMLKICERFASEFFSVIFNASKSMCMVVSKYGPSRSRLLASVNEVPFCLDGILCCLLLTSVVIWVICCLHVLMTNRTF